MLKLKLMLAKRRPLLPEVSIKMLKKPEGVSYRSSNSAPRYALIYALILLFGGVMAAGTCLWGLLRLTGLL